MLEMNIDSIRVSLHNLQRVVILRAKDTNRYLPIWIGAPEAESIAMKLQNVAAPRPLTHDLMGAMIASLGASVNRIIVSDLSNDTFYAKIVLQLDETTMEVDSRPSDAIALAVRSDAPIYADDVIIEKAGIEMDEETGKPMMPDNGENTGQPVREEELKNLSAFTDFIDTLNLDDLGRQEKPPPETNSSGTPEGG